MRPFNLLSITKRLRAVKDYEHCQHAAMLDYCGPRAAKFLERLNKVQNQTLFQLFTVVNSETVLNAVARGMDPESYLSGFDSYNFFKAYGGQIKTGPTFTNVMDIVVVLVE